VGRNFRDLHRQLDEIVDAACAGADAIAERMRALGAVPDGRCDTVAATTSLPAFPSGERSTDEVADLITLRLRAVASTLREVRDSVDAEDPPATDLLHESIETVEKYAWMVSAEVRRQASG
jgi:starvation-inducible DNA-binding protein